jgi:hypothetical protein
MFGLTYERVRLTPASTSIFTFKNSFCAKMREGILHAKVVVLQQHRGSTHASSAVVGSCERRDRDTEEDAGELPSFVPKPLEEKGERVPRRRCKIGRRSTAVWSRRFATHPAHRSTRHAPRGTPGGCTTPGTWRLCCSQSLDVVPLPKSAPLPEPRRRVTESASTRDGSTPIGDRWGWRWWGLAGLEEVEGVS